MTNIISEIDTVKIINKSFEGKSLPAIAKELNQPKEIILSVLKSDRVRKIIEEAQLDMLEALPAAGKAISGIIKDYADVDKRATMTPNQEHRAWLSSIKNLESVGVLADKQSTNITNIFNQNTTNISQNILNILGDSMKKQFEDCKDYEEVNYGEIKE